MVLKELFSFKKGQSAMEYLMIYGWALIAIVVVIGILYLFLPKETQQCFFEVQGRFLCNQPSIPSLTTTGALKGALYNGGPQKVNIIGITCSDSPQIPTTFTASVVSLASRGSTTFNDLVPGDVICVKQGGGAFAGGESFKGYIYLKWRYEPEADPDAPDRIDRATLVTVAG